MCDVVCSAPNGVTRLVFILSKSFYNWPYMKKMWCKHKSGNLTFLSTMQYLVFLSDAQQYFFGSYAMFFAQLKQQERFIRNFAKNMEVYFTWQSKRSAYPQNGWIMPINSVRIPIAQIEMCWYWVETDLWNIHEIKCYSANVMKMINVSESIYVDWFLKSTFFFFP